MRPLFVIAFASVVGISAGFAHATPAAPTDVQQNAVKDLRRQCAADARAKGLRGPAAQSAAMDCLAQARPDLATGIECRKQGMTQNLSGAALKDFVRSCRRDPSAKSAASAQSPVPAK